MSKSNGQADVQDQLKENMELEHELPAADPGDGFQEKDAAATTTSEAAQTETEARPELVHREAAVREQRDLARAKLDYESSPTARRGEAEKVVEELGLGRCRGMHPSKHDQMLPLLAIGEEAVDALARESRVAWREREEPRRVVDDRRWIKVRLWR